jgi:hypothetical protein
MQSGAIASKYLLISYLINKCFFCFQVKSNKCKGMAPQKGLIKLNAAVGGSTFYKPQYEYAAEKKVVWVAKESQTIRISKNLENDAEYVTTRKVFKMPRKAFRNRLPSSAKTG